MSRLKQNINGRSVRSECEDLDAGLQMYARHRAADKSTTSTVKLGALIVYVHLTSTTS